MGNTTLQQKEHQEVPDRPGKGAGDEAHIQYRLAVLAICSEMREAGHTYADIAARFCLCEDTLREWRKRYEENGKEGLRRREVGGVFAQERVRLHVGKQCQAPDNILAERKTHHARARRQRQKAVSRQQNQTPAARAVAGREAV